MCDSKSLEKKGLAEGYWSDEKIKEIFLDKQRRYLWNEDYWRNVFVPLLNLKQDSVILDVGCGLGFLGRKLAEYVPKGKVIGIDLDSKLIKAAKSTAVASESKYISDFCVSDAYKLPIDNESVDLSICQTLLMHVEKPLEVISEMQRVTKLGGKVVAIEPDYAGLSFFNTAYEALGFSLNDLAKMWYWEMVRALGKKKLGMGDDNIGSKVPYLFFKSGLRVVDVRCFDRVFWLIPPYQQKGNEFELQLLMLPPEFLAEKLNMRTYFFAGGGTEEKWREYFNTMKRVHEISKEQVEKMKFAAVIIQTVVITIGEKI